jgi:hypothetical protein
VSDSLLQATLWSAGPRERRDRQAHCLRVQTAIRVLLFIPSIRIVINSPAADLAIERAALSGVRTRFFTRK